MGRCVARVTGRVSRDAGRQCRNRATCEVHGKGLCRFHAALAVERVAAGKPALPALAGVCLACGAPCAACAARNGERKPARRVEPADNTDALAKACGWKEGR